MNYNEALEYIHSVSWLGSKPGLERIQKLCGMLGNPEDSLKFIHVAGTNGKGSFCSMLSEILCAQGYSVGLFTSPYVEFFNERIMYNGANISDEELAEVTEYVKNFAEHMTESPTEFELITAIALEYYKRKKCDYVVFECGLGGRLDSTNIIETPVLSVITGIDLDHTALLGSTTAEIAAEKAGIIKNGIPVMFGEGDSDAERVIKSCAAEKGSEYFKADYGRISNIDTCLCGTEFDFDEKHMKISLKGLYQVRNATNVLTAVNILRHNGTDISDEAVSTGLANAKWKARFETVLSSPLTIYDGAHNPQGINSAVENIHRYLGGNTVLLMGVMADKDYGQMISTLSPVTDKAFTVTPANTRSLASENVKNEFTAHGVEAESYEVLADGVYAAAEYAKKSGLPLMCLGSLYMYADVKKALLEYSKGFE